ncbi:MAG: DUF4224 domain-containing protein [Acidovorax sp.]|nr:DUF4224 domain-containing protein [Acidovorax sp.]
MIQPPPYLTDSEVLAMCEPLKQPAALCRYLMGLGLKVVTKPNGRPLLLRTELDRVLGASRFGQSPAHAAPNAEALRAHLKARRNNGTKA